MQFHTFFVENISEEESERNVLIVYLVSNQLRAATHRNFVNNALIFVEIFVFKLRTGNKMIVLFHC